MIDIYITSLFVSVLQTTTRQNRLLQAMQE